MKARRIAGFAAVCAAIWCGGSLAALGWLNREFFHESLPLWSTVQLWAGTLLLLAGEGVLTAAVLGFARSQRLPVAAAPVAVLSLLLWLTLVSWTLGGLQMGFLTAGSLLSYAADYESILPFVNLRERATLAFALVASIGVVAALFGRARPLALRQAAGLAGIGVTALAGALVCWRVLPAISGPEVAAERLAGIVKSRLVPSATLVWAPVLFAGSAENATVTVPLARRYDLESYAARIERGRKRPNVIVFIIEALRADAVHKVVNGRPVMPNVSRMAREGVEFQRAYAPGNESAYSLTSVISGQHTLRRKTRDTFTNVDYPMLTLADVLSPVYHTGFFSSSNEDWQHMKNFSRSPHLEYFLDAGSYAGKSLAPDPADSGAYEAYKKGLLRTGTLDDSSTVSELRKWVSAKLAGGDDRPVFAMASLQTSHYPYEQGFQIPAVFTPNAFSEAERAQFSFVSYPVWATERMWNRYWNSLLYIDGLIGGVVEMLRERGALEDTIVVVAGDHGEMFHESGEVTHAGRLRNLSVQIAFVLWGKGMTGRGPVTDPVSLVDLGPMMLDAVGMPAHEGFQGCGRLTQPGAARIPVFLSTQNLAYEDAVIAGNWKYVEQADRGYALLFDLKNDPGERRDLYGEYPLVRECLRETLRGFKNNQLAYYERREFKDAYWQPKHELARSKACEMAFPR